MQKDNKVFEDMGKMASGAMELFSGAKKELDSQMKKIFEDVVKSMNLVTKEEFDVAMDMVKKARLEQDKLNKKVAALEKKLKTTTSTSRKTETKKKTASTKKEKK